LAVSIGQFSDKGRKNINQDFHGVLVPEGAALALKGVTAAIADGVTPSPVSHVAAETAIKSFLTDYYATSDAWSVKTSGQRVISATNSWLHAQTMRSRDAYDTDHGYMCTLTAVVLKARTAHIFHVGDSRVAKLSGESLEPLTTDHRVVISSAESYLGRAMGRASDVEIDYHAVPLSVGDVFVFSTDGVHDFVEPRTLARMIIADADDLDRAARAIGEAALDAGSDDNLTVQIVRVDALPEEDAAEFVRQGADLPAPPIPEPPAEFEGYRILKEIHASTRSYVYLAEDMETGERVALKIPADDLRESPGLMAQLMTEEWVARRLASPFVLKAARSERPRRFLYAVTEYVEGRNLRRWMRDNPKPDLDTVRDIVEQIAMGLRAFHRREMIHRDLRPENVMIDEAGAVKIIDFGSARIAGVAETAPRYRGGEGEVLLGHLQYTAPECLAGEPATWRSDLFSLGVIAYELLTGRYPYGIEAARVRSRAQQRALRYASAVDDKRGVPDWVDGALHAATHPDPLKRYDALSEFINDLRTPNPKFARASDVPLAKRDPVRFWQGVSLALAVVVGALLVLLTR
jgi:serine/threonine protein phosphatase PrpC/predicted Ser/Thr protein kinase